MRALAHPSCMPSSTIHADQTTQRSLTLLGPTRFISVGMGLMGSYSCLWACTFLAATAWADIVPQSAANLDFTDMVRAALLQIAICVHTCIYTHACTCTHIYTHAHARTRTYMHGHTQTYKHRRFGVWNLMEGLLTLCAYCMRPPVYTTLIKGCRGKFCS
jgi:hypothetical protein